MVCFSGQRLWWFGSPTFPDRIWGSVVGDYENHFRGVADDDAVQYDLASEGVNQIRWAKGLDNGLAVGTIASEFTMMMANRQLDPEIETVFLMADEEYAHVSSTLIKQIAPLASDEKLLRFVPPEILPALRVKMKQDYRG